MKADYGWSEYFFFNNFNVVAVKNPTIRADQPVFVRTIHKDEYGIKKGYYL